MVREAMRAAGPVRGEVDDDVGGCGEAEEEERDGAVVVGRVGEGAGGDDVDGVVAAAGTGGPSGTRTSIGLAVTGSTADPATLEPFSSLDATSSLLAFSPSS